MDIDTQRLDIANIISHTPRQIANIIFSMSPDEPKSYNLRYETDETNETVTDDMQTVSVTIFEIFLTILMEGIFIKNNITKETLKNFNSSIITYLQPWLHSLGYSVNVRELNKENVQQYNKYYCKIILKVDPDWETFFELHENLMDKNYHFIFGSNNDYILNKKTKINLNDLFAIFIHNNKVYKIMFNYI